MLEPDYFNDKADRMLEIYRQLENFILQDIAERLLKAQSVSGTADWLLWKLQQMGESRTEILKKLSELTGLSRKELKALLQDAVITSWKDDYDTFTQLGVQITNPLENAAVRSVMDAEYKKCQGELENLTRTTINQAPRDLIKMLDEAEIRVASGVQSYSSAICDILDAYVQGGLVVEYPTGTRRTLEAAVRMCVITSMNQTSAQITNQYIIEAQCEYVLVSAHPGARIQPPGQPYLAGHENWQGKVYRIRGSEPGYPNLREMTGYDIDENGNGIVVNMLGLHGYGCRHSHTGWNKNLKNRYVDENGNPVIDREESRQIYKNQQKQRRMERAIRKTKRELLVKQQEIDMVTEPEIKEQLQKDYDRLSYKFRQQNAAYNNFCVENNLRRESDRLKVAGFRRAEAAKVNGRARAYEHWNRESPKKTGGTTGALNDGNDPLGERRELHAKKYYDEIRGRNKDVVIETMSANTGFRKNTVKTVYEHVFEKEHLFKDGKSKMFDPDYDMTQSFQRILDGKNIKPHDITLLRHERLEYLLMKKYNMIYEDAHKISEAKYNYAEELKNFLRKE